MSDEVNPVSLQGQARVDAVIASHEAAANQAKNDASGHLETASQVLGGVPQLRNKAAEGRNLLDQVTEQAAAERSKVFGLGGLFGEDNRRERVRVVQEEINARDARLLAAETTVGTALQDAAQAGQTMLRETVVRDANKLGGPLEGSEQMSQSLSRQDLLAKLAKEGYLNNNPEDTKYLPTMDFYKETVEMFMKADPRSYSGSETPQRRAERRVMDVLPMIEYITKFCDQNNVPLSEKLLQKSLVEGLQITQGVDGKDGSMVWRYVEGKKGGRISASEIGYYEIGAAQLDRFFDQRKNIQGINRVPYVLAYAAGALENGAPMHMALHTRNWLAETIPAQGLESEWKDGRWQVKEGEATSLGLGYMMANDRHYNFFEGETDKPGVVEIAQKAGEITSDLCEAFTNRRRFDAQRQFLSGTSGYRGMVYDGGKPRFSVPVLANR